jgi:Tfp pilus assembly protein PilF
VKVAGTGATVAGASLGSLASTRRPVARVMLGFLALGLAACSASSAPTTTQLTPRPPIGVLLDAGVHLMQQGNANAAAQLFEQAIQRDPTGVLGYYDLGTLYQRQGAVPKALHEYVLASAVDPRYVPALYNRAVILARADAPLAIYLFRKVIVLQPRAPTALLNLGILEARTKGMKASAVKDLRRAVALQPSLEHDVPAGLRKLLSTSH